MKRQNEKQNLGLQAECFPQCITYPSQTKEFFEEEQILSNAEDQSSHKRVYTGTFCVPEEQRLPQTFTSMIFFSPVTHLFEVLFLLVG